MSLGEFVTAVVPGALRGAERWASPVLIANGEPWQSKHTANVGVRLELRNPEADLQIPVVVPLVGVDKNGEQLSRNVLDLLRSVNAPQDLLARIIAGERFTIENVLGWVLGRPALVELELVAYLDRKHLTVYRWLPQAPYVGAAGPVDLRTEETALVPRGPTLPSR